MIPSKRIKALEEEIRILRITIEDKHNETKPLAAELKSLSAKIHREKQFINNADAAMPLRVRYEALRRKLSKRQLSLDHLKEMLKRTEMLKANLGRTTMRHHLDELPRVLRNFPACCAYDENPPADERDVQRSLWKMIRAVCPNVNRESVILGNGKKTYKPDFLFPDHKALLEVKCILDAKEAETRIHDQIVSITKRYLGHDPRYDKIFFFVYDKVNALLNQEMWVNQLKSEYSEIFDIIVVPRVDKPKKKVRSFGKNVRPHATQKAA